jgi:glycosyltransferase involved in cell wall biosynthesis
MQKVAIIIPCYNEGARLLPAQLAEVLTGNDSVTLYLANDGSTDGTLQLLQGIAASHANRCFAINYNKNQGKAATIQQTVNQLLLKGQYTHIGYFDADFSTPPAEVLRMLTAQQSQPQCFIAGSRMLLLNAKIQRRAYRHLIGRVIATIVDFKFKLGIYDTQCGAKLFPVAIAKVAFAKPFLTRWLFDVEIFIRLKQQGLLGAGIEFPLHKWTDVKGSKLKPATAFLILKELFLLNKYNVQ